jgi:Ca2+-binding RTX toxin-like protein
MPRPEQREDETMARINGTSRADELRGTAGRDFMWGFGGNDEIDGGARTDRIRGGNGNDEIDGDSGHDLLWGDAGHDEVDGGSGNDQLFGGTGRDELDGGSGNDRLSGGSGSDRLDGGAGNDQLFGGSGSDVFEFERDDRGADVIRDWTDGQDRLDLDDFNFTLARALNTGEQRGADVVFAFAAGVSVTIEDARLADFGAADFLL